jgi:predicted RNA binding protein YcfA (HicA-like mRNA interferase family)
VPRKIRELKSELRRAGFTQRPGKGSHTRWTHPLVPGRLTLAGHDGADAQNYQEEDVAAALAALAEAQRRPKP